MTLGIFDFFGGDWFNSWFAQKIGDILSFIPKLLYFICSCLLSIGDFFQVVFRKIAGLDPIIVSGETTQGDSFFTIITETIVGSGGNRFPALNIAFWSFIVIGLILLVVFAFVAIIRVEYMPDKDKGNSKGNIIKNFFIALANIAIIPVATLFGLYLGNQMLLILDNVTTTISSTQTDDVYQYFDKWTSAALNPNLVTTRTETYYAYEVFGEIIPTTSEPFSGMIFKASAYGANRFRKFGAEYLSQVKNTGTNLGFLNDGSVNEPETAATIIDIGFGMSAKLKNATDSGYTLNDSGISDEYYREGLGGNIIIGSYKGIKNFSKYNVKMVWFFYDLWSYNFIISFVGMIIIGKLYYTFCLMLMARVFEGFGLFIFAPISASMMPMDSGAAMGRWRKQFIGKYILLLGMVFGINIISPLLQIFQQFKFFNLAMLDYIVYSLFIVAGLNGANALSKAALNIMQEKGGDAYEGAVNTAGNINDSFTKGVGHTLRLGTAIGGLGATGARAVMGGAGKAVEWGHRGVLRTRERNAMGDTRITDNSRNRSRQEYRNMDRAQRSEFADHMFATDQGQRFIRDNFGGNEAAARQAIINGTYRDSTTGLFTGTGDNEQLLQYMHDRDLFNRTRAGERATEGSAEWTRGLNSFATMSVEDRQTELMHRAPINAQQAQIQQRRQQVIDHQPTNRFTRGIARARQGVGTAVGRFADSRVGRGVQRAGHNFTNVAIDLLNSLTPHGNQMFGGVRNRNNAGNPRR